MNDKILNLLGICRRAGKLTIGNDAVTDDAVNGKASLVLVACDVSQNTAKKLKNTCARCGTQVLKLNRTRDELSAAIGKFCAVAAVCDKGFAKRLCELISEENSPEDITV